ncbi:hypothetical protein FGIG_03048 [Fasciola gigantica]|uniref:Uncharacterized protein n=1 Tax=Fasciola gigantica TaxID=46835 RepID=A0A504Z399_FASGI|nr:hypothetical protein FGIG_03048 [Fasciola gigantica]
MARRPTSYKIQQPVQRQTSVNSSESFADERFPRVPNLHTPTYLGSPLNEGGKYLDKKGHSSSPGPDDVCSSQADPLRMRDQLSPRYLTGFDQNISGNSAAPAVSRVSHQPSFESYDSSMSANSWASSNEPEVNAIISHTFRDINPLVTSSNLQSTSPSLQSHTRHFASSPGDQTSDSSIQLFREAYEQGGVKIRINLEDNKRNPRKAGKSSDKSQLKLSDASGKNSKGPSNSISKNQIDLLKIIGSEKDNVSDVKFPVGGGAQNIKGLWKRAFQSLRKDKPKREPSLSKRREIPSSSDEIDPVYHLLRCAASKSQSTAIATTGLGPTRSVDRMKPNTVESPNSIQEISYGGECSSKCSPYGNEATSSKKSSNVTFRSPYHGSIFTSSEVEHRQDARMLLDDLTDATITVRSPARAIGQNILPDSRMKEAPLILDWGETILEGSAEDEKSREAQLAYEQHKRLNARRNMLKNAQKSLSFALEENAVERSVEQKRVQAYNSQHLRPPLNERMKSLSVDDKNDMEESKRWQDSSDQSTSHSSQLSRTPSVRGIRKPSHRELKERFPGETSEQKRTCRSECLSIQVQLIFYL